MKPSQYNENNPLKILIVDDNQNLAKTLSDILHGHGYICFTAHTTQEATKLLEKQTIDCVLSDVKMPEKSGLDLYAELKIHYPYLPYVLMTANASSDLLEEALKAGAIGTFVKPLDIERVLQFLSKLNNWRQVAFISDKESVCDQISQIPSNEHFVFSWFHSVNEFLHEKHKSFCTVFMDVHKDSEKIKQDIQKIMDHSPERTIIIRYDSGEVIDSIHLFDNQVRLIHAPHSPATAEDIIRTLESELFLKVRTIQI